MTYTYTDAELRSIPVAQLVPSPVNREEFDQRKLDELAASIKEAGVTQRLIVRVMPDNRASDDGQFEIVAGERRWRAAQIAGLEEVPCEVRTLSDGEAEQVQALENLHREDLSPLDQARKFESLLASQFAGNVTALSAACGYPADYIYRYLHLNDLIPDAQTALKSGNLNLALALELARYPSAAQLQGFEYWVREASYNARFSVSDLKRYMTRNVMLLLKSAPFKLEDSELVSEAGGCLECPKRTGADTLLFNDVGDEDLCLDKDCFHAKVNAHIAAQKAKKPDLVEITSEYRGPKDRPDLLSLLQYTEIRKKEDKCPSAETAIVVFGEGAGKLKKICRDPKCEKHGKAIRSSSHQDSLAVHADPKQERREKIEKNKQDRLDTKVRIAVLQKVAAKLTKADAENPDNLRAIAKAVFNHANFYMEQRMVIAPALWPELPKDKIKQYGSNKWDMEKAVEEHLKKLALPMDFYKFMFLVNHFNDCFSNHNAKAIDTLAKNFKVDVKAIRESVTNGSGARSGAAKSQTPLPTPAAKKNAAKRAAASN